MLARGHAIDRTALAGGSYRGTSLGLPRWLERATWTTFRKVFAPLKGDRLFGWNVRVDGLAVRFARSIPGIVLSTMPRFVAARSMSSNACEGASNSAR